MDLTHPADIDLLVIGGGLAGHAAALEAAELGASVLLVEKMADVGGSTIQSSGSFAFAGTQAQRDAGFEDSPEEIRNDIDAASGGLADPALVSVYVEGQADAYAWLKSKDVLFYPVTLSSNQTVPRTHATQPIQLMEALHAKVLDSERVHFIACAAARRLTTDARGTVTGAIFELNEGIGRSARGAGGACHRRILAKC